jgi:hypothetical protein
MMRQRSRITATSVVVMAIVSSAPIAPAQESGLGEPNIGDLLIKSKLEDTVDDLQRRLEAHPGNDEIRFALGMGRFLLSGEKLLMGLHRLGFDPDLSVVGWTIGTTRLPVPVNPEAPEVRYTDVERLLEQWRGDLLEADRVLAGIDDETVKLRLRLGLVQMDFNDDGVLEKDEALFAVFNRAQRRFTATRTGAESFDIAFDRGDVDWLRGYCHLCLALVEMTLAHDHEDLFNRAAHLLFKNPRTDYDFLEHPDPESQGEWWNTVDMISFIHGIRFEVVEPERLAHALEHLLQTIALSRGMWTHYNAETDDDREWIPNPSQATIIPRGAVTQIQQDQWLQFLDEAEALLKGERLLRFWRTADGLDRAEGLGVNVHRIFTEPRPFDLVFWIQGSAAQPYLEEGMLTEPKLWTRMEETFNRHTYRHMFWFN